MVDLREKWKQLSFNGTGDTQRFRGYTDLFEKAAFLDDVGDRLHLYAFCLVYVLEGIEFTCLLVLHYSDLGKRRQSAEQEDGK